MLATFFSIIANDTESKSDDTLQSYCFFFAWIILLLA